MKIKIIFIFIFFSQILNSQIIFKGFIVNTKNEPINRANIQLINSIDNNVISYVLSDKLGLFEIKISNIEQSYLKISAFGYDDQQIELINYSQQNRKIEPIVLMKIEQLDEVLLSYEKAFSITKDSISYNLSLIKNNTDANLKDLIKKLPGLEISDDGKVKFQGTKINRVLIDGNDFFGNKHQMATENITVEMIEKISVLFNNSNNILEKEFKENSTTDLNVTLNEESRKKIKGNIELNNSFKDEYKYQSNLFSFKKNGNISLILDYNNVGTNYLSVPDYIDMIGGLEDNSNKSIVEIDNYIPRFVYENENFENRKTKFSALNYTYNTEKIQLNTTVFFNRINQNKSENNERYFLNNPNEPSIIEEYFDTGKNSLLNGIFKIDYNINEKSTLKSYTSFNYNNNDFKSNVNNLFDTNRLNKSISLTEKIFYNQKIKQNFLFESNFIFDKNSYNDDLQISTNTSSILGISGDNLKQINNYDATSIELNNSILYKNKKDKYKVTTTLSSNSERFVSDLTNIGDNILNRNILTLKMGFDVTQNINDEISLNATTNIINNKINNRNSNTLIPYNLGLNYKASTTNYLSLKFSSNYEIPKIRNLFNGFVVQDYLNLNNQSFISSDQFINLKNFELSYSNYLKKAKLFISISSSFSYTNENITTNSNFVDGLYNYIDTVLGNNYSYFLSTLFMDKNFNRIPFKLRTVFSFKNTKLESFVNDISNNMILSNITLNNNFISIFKNSKFQLELSQISNFTTNKQEIDDSNFNLSSHIVNLSTKYAHENVNVEIKVGSLWQKNLENSIQQTLIGGSFSYALNKSFLATITLENILNTNEYLFLSQTTSNNILTNTLNARLPGYYLIGLKYNF